MAEMMPAPAFAALDSIGGGDGVFVRRIAPPMVAALAHKGQAATLIGRVAARGLTLRDAAKQSVGGGMTALGIGPGRWMILGLPVAALADLLPIASLSDHSDGYAVFEVWGPRGRATLAKGVPVDLDPTVFTDDVAVTAIAHMGAIVWQSAPDRFAIAVFRSHAGSFWHWLSASAAEYGLTAE